MTGIQIMKLGKILLYLMKNDEALEMLLEVGKSLSWDTVGPITVTLL